MSFLDRLFRKRQRPKSHDDVQVTLRTTMDLSEEQRNAIIDILKSCVMLNLEAGKINLKIWGATGIRKDIYVLNRTINSIDVIL